MGNREECPVCKAYGSDIYSEFDAHNPCPRCETSYESILNFWEIERKKKSYESQKISVELIAENESMKKELEIKRDRYNKFEQVVYNMYYRMEEMVKELEREWMKSINSWDEE